MAGENPLTAEELAQLAQAFSGLTSSGSTLAAQMQKLGIALNDARAKAEAEAKAEEARAKKAENLGNAFNTAKSATLGLAQSIAAADQSFQKYGTALKGGADAIYNLTKNAGAGAQAAGRAAQAMALMADQVFKQTDRIVGGFDALAEVGGAASTTAAEMQEAAEKAGISSFQLQSLGKNAAQSGQALVALGGSTGEGFRKLADITGRNLQNFRKLGLSQEEAIEASAKLTDQFVKSGVAFGKTPEQMAKSSKEYIENMQALSNITGQTRKEQERAQEEARSNAQFQQYLFDLAQKREAALASGDQAKADALEKQINNSKQLAASTASMGKTVHTATMQALASGGKVMTREIAQAQNMGIGLNKAAQDIAAGQKATAVAARLQDENAAGQKKINSQLGEAIRYGGEAVQNSLGMTQEQREAALATQTAIESYNKQHEDEIKKGNLRAVKSMAELNEIREKESKGKKDDVMDAKAEAEAAERKGQQIFDKVIKIFNPFLSGGLLSAAAFTALGLSAAFATKKLYGMGGGVGIPGVPGTVRGAGGAAGDAAGKAGAGLGKGLEALGGGAGKGLGSLLEGAAKGIASFANPMVVGGAAAFGTAIGLIGAGIAGASWLLGKTLPTLADGFNSFTKIDGDRLIKTGKGILELGKGMAVFGAGGAAAGIGGIISSFTKLFGAKSPIDQFEEFTKRDINIDRAERLTNAFANFASAAAGRPSAGGGAGGGARPGGAGGGGGAGAGGAVGTAAVKPPTAAGGKALPNAGGGGGAGAGGAVGTAAVKPPTAAGGKAPPKAGGGPSQAAPAKPAIGGGGGGGGAPAQPAGGGGGGDGITLAANFITSEEGLPKGGKAYWDPSGQTKLVSVGYGHQIKDEEYSQGFINAGGTKIPLKGNRGIDTVLTKEQATALLAMDLPKYTDSAAKPLSNQWNKLAAEQKAALTSYAYNTGTTKSLVNAGLLDAIAAKNSALGGSIIAEKGIHTAGGKPNATLKHRREKEGALFASAQISAADGGIAEGPMSGYPAVLHGKEMITPLKPNSKLERLSQTAANESSGAVISFEKIIQRISDQNAMSNASLASKLDQMIHVLEGSHNTQQKLLRVSR